MDEQKAVSLIIEASHEKGVSYSDMARALSLTDNGFRKKRLGLHQWKWAEVVKLARFLDVTLDEVYDVRSAAVC